jgi:hypothetical protein
MSRIPVVVFLLLLVASSLTSQTQTPTATSDPQALTVSNQAMLALTAGASVSDITLHGTATEIAGPSTQSGAATLQGRGFDEERYDNQASQRHIVRNAVGGAPQQAWSGADGVSHPVELHNALPDAAWFFPALGYLSVSAQPNILAKYIGLEQRNGASVQHLRFQRIFTKGSPKALPLAQQFSTVDMYLDATSYLPVVAAYNLHPDEDSSTNIPAEIHFSDYRNVNGLQVPFHIQRYMQGGLVLDFVVSSAAINSGLTDSNFSIQ